ncbi:hypothetical protein Q31b_16320 [Novipirellula aureliae]|uniref:Uncharacterized protein n=1 Tax=Novipirellula aureliae TaxID=2527966 RepID=A0A5C6E7Z3_9BACT|nr:hypothetical protein Q31b_16320 [Novipirellula aureliae]
MKWFLGTRLRTQSLADPAYRAQREENISPQGGSLATSCYAYAGRLHSRSKHQGLPSPRLPLFFTFPYLVLAYFGDEVDNLA